MAESKNSTGAVVKLVVSIAAIVMGVILIIPFLRERFESKSAS